MPCILMGGFGFRSSDPRHWEESLEFELWKLGTRSRKAQGLASRLDACQAAVGLGCVLLGPAMGLAWACFLADKAAV